MIVRTLSEINNSITNFAQSTYGSLATDIGTLGATLGAIGILIIVINMVFQIIPTHPGVLLIWFIKFMIVLAAASNWAFFQPIYDAISKAPGAISAQILGGTNMETAMQSAVDELWAAYDTMWSSAGVRQAGLYFGAIMVAIIAVLLTVAVILVVGISQMGLALSLGLAPIFIIGLLFRATSDLFTSWTKFTLSFILVLVLTATVISLLLNSISSAVSAAQFGTVLQDFAPLLVQAVASIFFLLMVPNYAMALAGSLAAGGISLVAAGAGAIGVTKSAIQSGAEKFDRGRTAVHQAKSMAASANEERQQGGSLRKQASASIQQFRDDQRASYTRSNNARLRDASRANVSNKSTPPSKK